MHECGLFLRRHGHPVRLRTASAGFGLVALSLVDGVVDATMHYDFGAVNPNLRGLTFRVNASNLLNTVYALRCTSLNIFGPYTNCVYRLRRQVVGTLLLRW